MADDVARFDPVRCAELAAPAITRAFVSGMRAGGPRGRELVAAYGGRAVGYLIDLRNPLAAGRSLTDDQLAAVYRYGDADERRTTVEASVAAGLLDRVGDAVVATERGRAFLDELFTLHGEVLAQHWDALFVDRLTPLLERLLAVAGETAGEAWAVQAPAHEPAGTPPAVVVLNRLSTMRAHRADAHAAAWQAAGWTAADVQAMPWGAPWTPERQAIEHDTNVRAAPPYAALTADERLTFIGALAALM